jgi:short-subunit dehydrogenase
MKSVAGKKVLVTGAAMGLGKLFALRAVQDGASEVIVWDLNEAALEQTVKELVGNGGTVSSYIVDVSDPQAIAEAAAQVRDEVGVIEVLINNAGIVRGNGYFWENNATDVELTMQVNSIAPMLIAREFLPGMVELDTDCRVVTIASSAGLVSTPRLAVYCGSKWAATGWSDSVRLELEQAGYDHIKMTTVCPTYINTGMFDGAKGILFTPTLEQEDVVDETWSHMLRGEPFAIMPWTSRLNRALYGLLPIGVRDFYMQKAGVYNSMDDFTGHDD